MTLTIDGRSVQASDRATILDVARREKIFIPTLCYDERLAAFGACRVCLVGVAGARGPVAACTTPVREGMVVDTRDDAATRVARGVVELVLSDYPERSLSAADAARNELAQVAKHFGLSSSRYRGERHSYAKDDRHPYIKMDLDECIVCGRCVRACDEVQGTFALAYAGRGWGTKIVAGVDSGFTDSACVSCGACVSTCPTSALDEAAFQRKETLDQTVTTTCAYCGVGCSLDVNVRGGAVVSIDPTPDGPSNVGHTCVKGRFAHQYARSKERITSPMLRAADGSWRKASWEEAMTFVAEKMLAVKKAHGEDAISFVSSSRCTNEENYVLMKLVRAALGTNNIDNCSRVCHSPTSMGLIQSFGESGGTNSFEDLDVTECLFLTGANPTEGHPVVGARMKAARLRGAKLIVADPRRIELAAMADVFLQLRPGTNVALYNGIAHVIVRDRLYDERFVADRASGFEEWAKLVATYDPKRVEGITGVPAALIEKAAHLYATTRPAAIFYGLGVTEQAQGVAGVRCLANLSLLTGNLGKRGAGSNPLRGQNNVQGSSDVGALPTYLTMYRKMADDETRRQFEAKWGCTIKPERGLMIPEMFDAAIAGKLKAMYVFGEDIAQTDPNVHHVVEALEKLDLLVVHDIFENETARYAHVLLPGSSFLEKTGTFTNAERRVQLVREAVPPPGDAKRDLDILFELSARLGYPMPHRSASDVMDEIAELTPQWRGISYARLEGGGLQWPVPSADHPGTPVLYTERFGTESGRANFHPVDWEPPGESATAERPFILITGRQLAHYNSGTQTRRTANAELQPADLVEIHPSDAARLGIAADDMVEIESARGKVSTWACVTTRVAPGNVFLSFHFPEVKTNLLTSGNADPLTSCPEYKVTAVAVRKVPGVHPPPPATAKGFRQDAFD
ncbi:MAG: formate dehydrogenase subunit alpha [Deltaproteobacteria bacterium]|nr:formate dehydrogenase subunit alpha [Deltaproteobacteria bacterium]